MEQKIKLKIKLKNSVLMLLSEMIEVMDIKSDLLNLDGKTDEEIGEQLVILFISKLYKAKKQFYDFVIKYKNIEIDDNKLSDEAKYELKVKKAEEMDAIEIFKEIFQVEGLLNFFASK